jgi:hypothetical protein
MVSLNTKHSRSRPRDGRVWLPRHASLAMTGCEALGTMYLQGRLHSCWGLPKTPMVHDRELSINPVRAQGRNCSDTPNADSRRCLSITFFSSIVQPGDREYLRGLHNVNHTEHGKSYEPHWNIMVSRPQGRGMVQRIEELRKSKRRPVIGRIGSYDLTRKGANFLVVETVKSL